MKSAFVYTSAIRARADLLCSARVFRPNSDIGLRGQQPMRELKKMGPARGRRRQKREPFVCLASWQNRGERCVCTMESKCLSAFRGAIVRPVLSRGPPSSQACPRPSVGADLGRNRPLSGEHRLRSCSMTRAIRIHRTGRPEVLVKTAGPTVLLA
jgi:hypothetical protein